MASQVCFNESAAPVMVERTHACLVFLFVLATLPALLYASLCGCWVGLFVGWPRVRLVALVLSINERGIAARIPDHLAVSRRAEHLFGTAAKAALLARVSTSTSGVAQQQWPTHRP